MSRPSAARRAQWVLLVSCEHAGNRVPADCAHLLAKASGLLDSHRGYDRGALALARGLSRRLRAPLFAATTTRLLVDVNRTPGNPRVFSRYVKQLPEREKAELMRRLHEPHWKRVARAAERALARRRRVLHLSVHSFTPVLRGRRRELELGLLYDARRAAERRLCLGWQRELEAAGTGLRVRRNAPYRGSADGLARALRRRLPAQAYLGIELELNQGLLAQGRFPPGLADWLASSLLASLPAGATRPRRRGGAT